MAGDAFDKYLSGINEAYLRGDATEHTHRPALKALIEALGEKITATNEPKRRTDCGAPDILVSKRKRKLDFRIGYIECKDIGTDLKKEEKTEQIKKRYLPSLHNFILTDYLSFRWYTYEELRLTATLARESEGGVFKATEGGKDEAKELLRGFLEHEAEKVSSAKELAVRMGHTARMLRDVTKTIFEQEEKTGPLHVHLAAFRKVLLPGLSEDEFADMYAQVIGYGLFAAWCHVEGVSVFGKDKYGGFHGMDLKGEQLTREHAAYLLPKTNPFLRKIFGQIVGPDLDDRLVWIVDDVVELLREAKMESVLKGFGRKGGRSDPVVHFYETFLKEYDPELRELRGVYYTPDEVVSYIVRSVDWLLKEKFGLKRGLGDESTVEVDGKKVAKVLILDPAVGTGTFLFQVIQEIYKKFHRQKGAWASYVKSQLLSRLFGFEFMMAPYAIAHTRLGLELSELGYDFESDERLGIYLTNTLEEAQKIAENIFVQGLSEEAAEANRVKRDLPIMVVLGNPPYSGHSANKGEWIRGLLRGSDSLTGKSSQSYFRVDGEALRERQSKWLNDDYVKFIRFAQWRIERTGSGILAFITNHGYLDNPTFRGMREALMDSFDEIYVLDLHGNLKKKETCPDGSRDENVFDIQQGVAVGIFVKMGGDRRAREVRHADCYGLRRNKYSWLSRNHVGTTEWEAIKPRGGFYLFVPESDELHAEWEASVAMEKIFGVSSIGAMSGHDGFIVCFERAELEVRIRELRSNLHDEEITGKYGLKDHQNWRMEKCREELRRDRDWEKRFCRFYYRPFDERVTYYAEYSFARSLYWLMEHLLVGEGLGLVLGRQGMAVGGSEWDVITCTKMPSDLNIFRRGGGMVFPVYLYHYKDKFKGKHSELFGRLDLDWDETETGRIPNLSRDFVEELRRRIRLEFVSDGRGSVLDSRLRGNDKGTFGPEDVFDYIYGVLHSPEYRRRYAEFLKIDFPRVPWPKGRGIFKKVCAVGGQLVRLHLMEAEILEDERRWPGFGVVGDNVVEKGYPKYVAHAEKADKARVYINKDQYFEGVWQDVWEFHIGGYQVCEKWLKDRRGRRLSFDDIRHYQKVLVALGETIRLMKERCLVEMFEA